MFLFICPKQKKTNYAMHIHLRKIGSYIIVIILLKNIIETI